MQPDLEMAARFLAALSPDAAFTFQTFADSPRARGRQAVILHGTLASRAQSLADLNARGAGIFVMVNRGDGKGRKATNVTSCRALFVDLDGSPLEPVLAGPIAPSIVVESSPSRWHAYWPIADLPPEEFSAAQKALAGRFDADPKVCDLPRVMRLPGFVHHKGAPFLSRLIRSETSALTWDEMQRAFGLCLTLPSVVATGERNATLFALAASARKRGLPQRQELTTLLAINRERCEPPLSDDEVVGIVERAYAGRVKHAVSIPHDILESDAYASLSDGARTILTLAYWRAAGQSRPFTLTFEQCARYFRYSKRFYQLRQELIAAGLIVIFSEAKKPRNGHKAAPATYRFPGVKNYPRKNAISGSQKLPSLALQALATDLAVGLDPERPPEHKNDAPEKPRRAA